MRASVMGGCVCLCVCVCVCVCEHISENCAYKCIHADVCGVCVCMCVCVCVCVHVCVYYDCNMTRPCIFLCLKEVDYEQANQQFFNLTVIAEDPNPYHTATAYVAISVRDFNDNAPAIKPQAISKDIYENATQSYHVTTFNATDMDSGDNAKFE